MKKTKIKETMLNRWAKHIDERRAIMAFVDWADNESETARYIDMEKLLDQYHGINQKQLEKERQALLEAIKSNTE